MKKPTAIYEDKRTQGKTLEEDAKGVLARVVNTPHANVEDLGREDLQLRENDDRDAMITAVRGEAAKLASYVSPDNPERQLSPEDVERTLASLKTRFDANSHLHNGLDWSKVKAALEANPEALWSVNKMEAEGHEPDVYYFDNHGFDIGTCSAETPFSTRNCTYDAEAVAWLKERNPDLKGSAVEMAEAMGISLMSPTQYTEVLQRKGKFDHQAFSRLLTSKAIRETGESIHGYRHGDCGLTSLTIANHHFANVGWRGSLRVLWS